VVDVGIIALAASGYSRENEREADRYIATVFAKTGHSVARGAAFYRTLLELVPPTSRGTTSLFAGHPETRERLAALTSLAPATPPPPRNSPAFAEVKTVFPTRKAYLRS
jgi:predicted Zn-dependent protease